MARGRARTRGKGRARLREELSHLEPPRLGRNVQRLAAWLGLGLGLVVRVSGWQPATKQMRRRVTVERGGEERGGRSAAVKRAQGLRAHRRAVVHKACTSCVHKA